MSAPPERRFTTIDALVLLAALSLGVAWMIEARTLLISFATVDGLLRRPQDPLVGFFAPSISSCFADRCMV